MAWNYIRIAIFMAGFIIGLLVSSSGTPARARMDASFGDARVIRENKENRCEKSHYTLIRAKAPQPPAILHF